MKKLPLILILLLNGCLAVSGQSEFYTAKDGRKYTLHCITYVTSPPETKCDTLWVPVFKNHYDTSLVYPVIGLQIQQPKPDTIKCWFKEVETHKKGERIYYKQPDGTFLGFGDEYYEDCILEKWSKGYVIQDHSGIDTRKIQDSSIPLQFFYEDKTKVTNKVITVIER